MTIAAAEAARELRRRAEAQSLTNAATLQPPYPDTEKLLHELQVQQIELEMQNEELFRVQTELVAERSDYLELYDLAPVGYLTVCDKGLIKRANLTAAGMLGVTRNFLLHKPLSQFIWHEDQDVYYQRGKLLMESEELQSWEMRLKRADGSALWVLLRANSAHNGEYRITFTDSTEHKSMMSSLRESEERYRLLAETMLQGVVQQNADGIITYMNPAAESILGRSRNELLGGNSVSIEHLTIRENGQIFPGLEHPAMVASQTGSPVQNVLMGIFNAKKDSYCWLNVTSVPVFSQDNSRPSEVYTIFEDITMRKRTEEELANSEVRYRQLFEMEADSIIMADRESNCIIEVNPAASKLFGYTREEFFRLKVSDLSATSEQTEVDVHNGITRIPHRRARKKDGTEFSVELTVCYFTYQCRTVHVATIRDITERTRTEKLLEDLLHRLSNMHEHQIKMQEQERLAISRNIHDDLGQSISLLKLDMEMVQLKKCSDCNILEDTIRAMCESLDQIAVKVQQIAFELRPPLLDNMGLHAAIEWQVNEIKKRCAIDFILILNEEIELLNESAATVVMRIFQEGLTNIIRHSKATEVSISLCKKGSDLILEISDNGCGITPEQLASPTAYGLMGMQERAKSCRGELTVTGDPDNGTILSLTLPLHQGA